MNPTFGYTLIFDSLLQNAKVLFEFDGRKHVCQLTLINPDENNLIVNGFCSHRPMADWLISELRAAYHRDLISNIDYLPYKLSDLHSLYVCVQAPACVREMPNHRSQLVSQIWYGMPVGLLYINAENWAYIRCPDGYLGWVEPEALAKTSIGTVIDFNLDKYVRFSNITKQIFVKNDNCQNNILRMHAGALLCIDASMLKNDNEKVLTNEELSVNLPNNQKSWIDAAAVHHNWQISPNTGLDALGYALAHAGTSYLWGGNTPFGFDCSGVVQWAYWMAAGVLLPRDASQQVLIGQALALDNVDSWQAGDLLFFGNTEEKISHVAIWQNNNQANNPQLYFHASGFLRTNSLLPSHELYEPMRHQTLRQVRRLDLETLEKYHINGHSWFVHSK